MKSTINAQGQKEVAFTGKLIGTPSEKRWENKNGKKYALVSIEAFLGGAKKTIQAMLYEKNLAYGVTVGQSYSCRAIFVNGPDQDPLIQMSHLATAGRASASDFAGAFEDVESEVPTTELAKG